MYCYRVSMHCLFRIFATCFYFPKIEHASIVVRFLKFLLSQVGLVGVRWFNIWYDLQYCIILHRIFHIWAQPRVTSRPPSEEGEIGGNGSDSEIVGWVDPVYWVHVRGPAGRQSQHLRMGFAGTSGARTGDPNVEGSFSAISKPVFAIKIITIFMLQCFELLFSTFKLQNLQELHPFAFEAQQLQLFCAISKQFSKFSADCLRNFAFSSNISWNCRNSVIS